MVVAFLRGLQTVAEKYYSGRPDRPVNYEDLAYLVGQFADSESGEYDNPALQPLHEVIRPEVEAILRNGGQDEDLRWSVHELATEARNYIADVAWQSLRPEHGGAHLGQFVSFIRGAGIEDLSIFTLNHDTLLERSLTAAGVEFTDGFGPPINGVRYWEPQRFREPAPRTRLVKLHGSVDWFRLRPDEGGFHEERVGMVSSYPYDTIDPKGRRQMPLDGRPILLVGTHNKAMAYLDPPLNDAHFEFYRRLGWEGASAIMLVGYGGHDKAINARIVEWMYADPSRRIAIVNRAGERLARDARGAIANGIPRWRAEGRLGMIPKAIEEVSEAEYRSSVGL